MTRVAFLENWKRTVNRHRVRASLDSTRMTVPPGQLSGSAALDVDAVDWTEVENLLKDAYRMTAPKRLVAKLEICQRITT